MPFLELFRMNLAKFRKDYYNTIFYCRILHLYFKWGTMEKLGQKMQKQKTPPRS
ncbi:hypothetical protein B23_0645 [Geobacillus thermoleovorans B23]|nr:hypothetical protein B23_0645 [Geobacillus thermoleovorans B23]